MSGFAPTSQHHGTVPRPCYGWVGLCGGHVLYWLQSLHSGWLQELGVHGALPTHSFSWQESRCGCPAERLPALQAHSMPESICQGLQVWALWLTVEPGSPPEHSTGYLQTCQSLPVSAWQLGLLPCQEVWVRLGQQWLGGHRSTTAGLMLFGAAETRQWPKPKACWTPGYLDVVHASHHI